MAKATSPVFAFGAPASFGTFIAALCGNKAATAAVRQDMIRQQIVVALKGNNTQWMDGAKEAGKGKGKVAAALLAGFMAVGMIAVLYKPNTPAFDALSKEDRAAGVEARAAELLTTFEEAYTAALPVEKTAAEKEADKTAKADEKAAELAKAVDTAIAERGLVEKTAVLTPAEVVALALSIIKAGGIGDALADDFRDVLGFAAAKTQAFEAGKIAGLAQAADSATAAALANAAAPAAAKARGNRKAKDTAAA